MLRSAAPGPELSSSQVSVACFKARANFVFDGAGKGTNSPATSRASGLRHQRRSANRSADAHIRPPTAAILADVGIRAPAAQMRPARGAWVVELVLRQFACRWTKLLDLAIRTIRTARVAATPPVPDEPMAEQRPSFPR